jgi:hypothetical protein
VCSCARCARSVGWRVYFDRRSCACAMRPENGGWSSRTLALGPLLLLFSSGSLF